MPEKRRGTEPQQQGPLLGTAVATVASSDDPGVRPPPGPRSLAPPLSAEEVSLGDSREHGGASRARAELDSSKIGSNAGFKAAINSYLRCRTKDGDGYLVPLLQALVRDEGGVHSNGAFMVSNGKDWVSIPTV